VYKYHDNVFVTCLTETIGQFYDFTSMFSSLAVFITCGSHFFTFQFFFDIFFGNCSFNLICPVSPWSSHSCTCTSVTKQYYLVLV